MTKARCSIVLAACLCLCQSAVFAQDKIVAVVNKDIITQKDLSDFVTFARMQMASQYSAAEVDKRIASMQKDLLDKLIEDRLLVQEAKKGKVAVDEARIKARINEMRERYGSNADFQAALARQGLTPADIEAKVREQALMFGVIDQKVRSRIVINPLDVTEYYQQHADQFQVPEARDLTSYTTKDSAKADQIYSALSSGQDAEAFKNDASVVVDSICASRGQLRKDIDDAVFGLSVGAVSKPLKVDDKYYVFRLKTVTSSCQRNLSDVRDDVYSLLFNQKMQESLARWLDDLKKHAYIKIF